MSIRIAMACFYPIFLALIMILWRWYRHPDRIILLILSIVGLVLSGLVLALSTLLRMP